MKINIFKCLLVVCLTTITTSFYAQDNSGKVINNEGVAISKVEIRIANTLVTTTDSNGVFVLSQTYPLPIEITLKHPDYYIKTVIFSLDKNILTLYALVEVQDLDEIMVSSTYQKESKVIVPTTKITADKFDSYSPQNLVAAINETPGVYIQSGALNTNRIVIRGVGSRTLFGTDKIRAYFNGIPITNGGGETSIDAFDPEDIADLEIVKGPKATQYGTNLGGTLLLNSKQALDGETYIKNNLTVGSFGMLKTNVSVATADDKLALNLNYDHLKFDGFRDNSNYDRQAVLVTSNYKLNSKNDLGVLINYTDYIAQIPSSLGRTAFNEDPSQAAFTWNAAQGFEDNQQILLGLNYTHRFSDDFSNTTAVFYTYLDHYEPRPFNILDEYTNGYGARTLFAKTFTWLERKTVLSFGGEFYNDQYNWQTLDNLYQENNGNGSLEGELLSDNIEKRRNLNVFTTVTIPISKTLKAQLGLNINTTQYKFTDQFNSGEANRDADRNFDPIVAPNVNVTYQFTPNANTYLNFSRGFNYPSLEETLTPEGLINAELGPETGYNYELGSEVYAFKRQLKIQLSAYLMDITDLLVAERVGEDQFIGRNAGRTQHKGMELALVYTRQFKNNFSLAPFINAEITDYRFIDFVDDDEDFSGNQLTGVPNVKVNGGIKFGYKNLNLYTNVLHIGEIPIDDGNTLYSDPYTVLNAKLAFSTKLTTRLSLEVNAGINNIADKAYASSILINANAFGNAEPRYFYPGAPRNWFGGLRMAFEL